MNIAEKINEQKMIMDRAHAHLANAVLKYARANAASACEFKYNEANIEWPCVATLVIGTTSPDIILKYGGIANEKSFLIPLEKLSEDSQKDVNEIIGMIIDRDHQ